MTRLLGAEFFKLRTTRTFYGMVGGCLGLVALISLLTALIGHPQPSDDVMRNVMALLGGLTQAFAMVLGVLGITTEFRHGTITPTLLVVPRRIQLLVAKLGASALTGLALGLLSTGLITLIVAGLLSGARGYDDGSTGSQIVKMIVGGTLGTGLFALIGLGFGAIVRNQVGAIIGGLVFMLVVEPLLTIIPTFGDWVTKYGLGGTGSALSGSGDPTTDVLGQVPGGLLLLAWTALFVIVGTALVNTRDVSA